MIYKSVGKSTHVVMAKVLDCDLEVSKFEFQLHYYIHFWANALGKCMNPLIFPPVGLNSIIAVPQG